MKTQLSIYFTILVFVGLYGCRHDDRRQVSGTSGGVVKQTRLSMSGDQKTAIGPFHWSIDEDSFSKLLNDWTKELTTVDGQIALCGMRIKSDGIYPSFDKNGFLNKIRIDFQSFNIHPEIDYAEEEKIQLQKICADHNGKVLMLIYKLSDVYGAPSEQYLKKDNISLYLDEGEKVLCKWVTEDTKLELNANTQLFPHKYGCKTDFWLELTKID